jgi:hypothetical protein
MARIPAPALLVALSVLAQSQPAWGDEEEIGRLLREKGATVAEAKGLVTSVEASDCSKWTDEDFRQLGHLVHLRNLSLGPGLSDSTVALLTGLSELDTLQTNLSTMTDDGVKWLVQLKKLKNVKFFHPGKFFTGAGLAQLAELPNLERITVAGSLEFGDEGMAAVSKLANLKEVRTWHAGQTLEGVKKLRDLKNLKSLTLGQRLAYKPPTSLSNETLFVLAEMKSLESLQLEEARLAFDSLIQLKQLPGLKKLTLEGVDIPEESVERLRKELSKTEIKWTKPNDVYMKRIRAMFGNE